MMNLHYGGDEDYDDDDDDGDNGDNKGKDYDEM